MVIDLLLFGFGSCSAAVVPKYSYSYADIKHCYERALGELKSAAGMQ
jgi:hypothetical protein